MSSVTSITPSAALCVAGTTAATIAGVGLTGATGVRFVGVEHPLDSFDALAPVVLSPTSISCTIPGSRRTQHYDVVVHLPGGDVTLASGFSIGGSPYFNAWRMDGAVRATYYTQISTAGGQKINLQGGWLDETTEVYVGGVLCTGLTLGPYVDTYGGGRTASCTTPAHAGGVVGVQVVSRYGTVTVANVFTYGDPPRIDHIGRSEQVDAHGVAGGTSDNVGVTADGHIGLAVNGAHFTGLINLRVGGVAIIGGVQMRLAGGGFSDSVILGRIPTMAVRDGTRLRVSVENQFGIGVAAQCVSVGGTGAPFWVAGAWYPDHCVVLAPGKYGIWRKVSQSVGNMTEPLILSGRQPRPGTPLHGYDVMWVYVDPLTHIEYNIDPQYDSVDGYPPDISWRSGPGWIDTPIVPVVPQAYTITPDWDWVEGGAVCRIDGWGFLAGGVNAVLFGTTLATGFVLVDDHTITCVVPPHAAGPVTVTVAGFSGDSTLPFTYRAHPRRQPHLFVQT